MEFQNIQGVYCHGSQNKFILIDEYDTLHIPENYKSTFTKNLTLHSNIKLDGVAFVQKTSLADGMMRFFNNDGSEASMCGNGIRCVARYVYQRLKKNNLRISTFKGVYNVNKVDDIYPDILTFEVNLNTISFQTKDIAIPVDNIFLEQPIKEIDNHLLFSFVAVPNPHLVAFVQEIDWQQLKILGDKINNEYKHLFPFGLNVSFVKHINAETIYVATNERGTGLTYSCGSAMLASTLISVVINRCPINKNINVLNKGGMTKCRIEKIANLNYSGYLIGNASFDKIIQMSGMINKTPYTLKETKCYQTEIDNYNHFRLAIEKQFNTKNFIKNDW